MVQIPVGEKIFSSYTLCFLPLKRVTHWRGIKTNFPYPLLHGVSLNAIKTHLKFEFEFNSSWNSKFDYKYLRQIASFRPQLDSSSSSHIADLLHRWILRLEPNLPISGTETSCDPRHGRETFPYFLILHSALQAINCLINLLGLYRAWWKPQ